MLGRGSGTASALAASEGSKADEEEGPSTGRALSPPVPAWSNPGPIPSKGTDADAPSPTQPVGVLKCHLCGKMVKGDRWGTVDPHRPPTPPPMRGAWVAARTPRPHRTPAQGTWLTPSQTPMPPWTPSQGAWVRPCRNGMLHSGKSGRTSAWNGRLTRLSRKRGRPKRGHSERNRFLDRILDWGPIQGWIFHRSAYKPASFQQHIETQSWLCHD